MIPVSVITPTIAGREHLLLECRLSVKAQTHRHVEHIVMDDIGLVGCAKTMNRAARLAKGEWLIPLADDDLLCPGAVETFISASEDADVVYAPTLVWGEDAQQFLGEPPRMPSIAMIRASAWENVGGYNEDLANTEDQDLWERLMEHRARFVKVESGPTHIYRFHRLKDGSPGNKSRQ